MKHLIIPMILLSVCASVSQAQVGINSTGNAPDNSAGLDIDFNDRGLLIPRLSAAERDAISNPALALQIFNTTSNCLEFYASGGWHTIACACTNPAAPTAGTHVTGEAFITWNWNAVSGATGYRYNTSDDYQTSVDNGGSTSVTTGSLNCNSPYTLYIWAYSGTCHSSSALLSASTGLCPFVCGGQLTDLRDNKSYPTVQISNECWMAANLDYSSNGSFVTGNQHQTNNGVVEKYCYDNNGANCAIYGGLYQWGEMVNYYNGASNSTAWSPAPSGDLQGICPTGWHLPTKTEWDAMITFLGGAGVAGGKLKEAGLTHWASPNEGATNQSGFTSLPGGLKQAPPDASFAIINSYSCHWVLTPISTWQAYMKRMDFNNSSVQEGNEDKSRGFSIRCLKD
jgi:uncharacterized protein (TIGR02145 family)